jgi:hypothetical protein
MEGVAVLKPSRGATRAIRTTRGARPKARGRLHRRSPQAANFGDRCSPVCTLGSASSLIRTSSLESTSGSRVRVAPSTKMTASMMPPAIDRKEGEGTSITAEREISTVAPESSTALPAVSMVSATACRGDSCWPMRAARKRTTMKRA